MSGGEPDISGRWTGMFRYPALYPPNTFEATIRDAGGIVTGVISQPRETMEAPGPPHQAVIDGTRTGTEVRFVKVYDDLSRATPHYRGTILPGGDEIEGEWTIPGNWSGTFFMIRAAKAEEEAEKKIAEPVD